MPKAFSSVHDHDHYRRMADAHGHHNAHQHQQTYYLPSPSQPNTLPDHSHPHQHPHTHQQTTLSPPLAAYNNNYQYASTYASESTSPTTPTTGATARGSPYGTAPTTSRINPLHRGEACLTCRRRKMKCDAGKPSCGPCSRQGKADECEYEESRFLAQIARLEAEVAQLRARIRELEGTPEASSGSASGNPTNLPSGAGSPDAARPLHVGEFDYSQSQSQSQSQTGFTSFVPQTQTQTQTQTSSVRRSPGQEAARPASTFGYDGQQQQYPQQYAHPHSQHPPSPPGLTPGTELNPEAFGRIMSALLPHATPLFLPASSVAFLRNLMARGAPIPAQMEVLVEASCAIAVSLWGEKGVARTANTRTFILRTESALARAFVVLGTLDPASIFPPSSTPDAFGLLQDSSPRGAQSVGLSPTPTLTSGHPGSFTPPGQQGANLHLLSPTFTLAGSSPSGSTSSSHSQGNSPQAPFTAHFAVPVPSQDVEMMHQPPLPALQITATTPQHQQHPYSLPATPASAGTGLHLATQFPFPVLTSGLPTPISATAPVSTSAATPTQRRTILHALQSLCLLASLAFTSGRRLEGHKHLGAAVRLAASVGLHRLPPPSSVPPSDASLLDEARETFWMVFSTERAWAGAGLAGLTSEGFGQLVDAGMVVTSFSPSAHHVKNEHGGFEAVTPAPVSVMRDPGAEVAEVDFGLGVESAESGSAKMHALTARAVELSARWGNDPHSSTNPSLHLVHASTVLALERAAATYPLIANAALVRLLDASNDIEGAGRAARRVVAALGGVGEDGWERFECTVGHHLTIVESFLRRQLQVHGSNSAYVQAHSHDLELVHHALRRLSGWMAYIQIGVPHVFTR